SQSSPRSIVPSPHSVGLMHAPSSQMRSVPQGLPLSCGVLAVHLWFAVSQVLVPRHGSESAQFRVESSGVHVYLQSFSQPSLGTVFESSHSSPLSTAPLPQVAIEHTPPRQILPFPQASASRLEALCSHKCAVLLHFQDS